VITQGAGSAARPDVSDLIPTLEWLDRILADAVGRAREAFTTEGTADRFRGLYISDRDVDGLLAREPAAPLLWSANGNGGSGFSSRLDWLVESFGLPSFDRAVLVLALAPEVDLRYERLYAYLQDDVTRKRPSVDLALNLFCRSAEDRLAGIEHFLSSGALIRNHLVELVPDPVATKPPLLAHYLVIDERIVGFLLGYGAVDRRLAPHATLWDEEDATEPADPEWTRLGHWIRRAHIQGEPLRLYFQGVAGSGRRRAARAAAAQAGRSLLEVATVTLPPDDDAAGRVLSQAVREAWLQDAVLYLSGADQLLGAHHAARQARLRSALDDFAGTAILAGESAWVPGAMGLPGVVPIRFEVAPVEVRRRHWVEAMAETARPETTTVLTDLATRYRFTRQQVGAAVAAAVARAGAAGSAVPVELTRRDLFAAARQQSGHALAALATRIEPAHSWNDLVVPDSTMDQLRELCQRVIHREQVMGTWGFGARGPRGNGINALFCGGSGTGKTMAAEIVAGELGLDLFRAELAGLVSKYIGETEKNLDRIFEAAEQTDGIVFFDEADALFGKRSEVHDSHDRYANLEISYLLQRMEQYDGVAILATNLRGNLDQAFVRRLAYTVHFPLPDERSRRAIWERVWPREVPLDGDVDLDALAGRFTLTGGSIRNIALAAAFLAASDGTNVTMAHVLRAVRREYEKIGKTLSDDELAGPESAAPRSFRESPE
jgi:ATP-dependent 26S proteasome regulatory subunit